MNTSQMACAVCTCLTIGSFNVNASLIDSGAYTEDSNTSLDWLRCETKNNQSNNPVLDQHRNGGLYDGWQSANGAEADNFTGNCDFNNHCGSQPGDSSKAWSHSTSRVDRHPDNHSPSNDWNMRMETRGSDDWSHTYYNEHRGQRYERYSHSEYDDHEFFRRCLHHDKVPPVPVPPAAWLFGFGLLGLIGIARRKKTA